MGHGQETEKVRALGTDLKVFLLQSKVSGLQLSPKRAEERERGGKSEFSVLGRDGCTL